MSVARQENWLGEQRVDVPHLRSISSSVASDFSLLAGTIMTGNRALVVSGFDIVQPSAAIGKAASALQVNVAGATVMHALASEAGTIFQAPLTAANEILNTANTKLIGGFTANQVNFIGIDLRRTADASTADLVEFLDPNTNTEVPETIPLARTLSYIIIISNQDFSVLPGVLPLAKVTTDVNNFVTAIEDSRNFMFRLGQGGSVSNAFFAYPWPLGRTEVGNNTDFTVADKAITSQKDWQDAMMTRQWELGGGEHWYSPTADRNVRMTRTGPTFADGEWFSWDGTNLLWKGIKFVFDNSTGFYNDVKDQTVSSAGLTDLADGDCIYVDLDRTQNLGPSSPPFAAGLQAVKVPFVTLGTPVVPGSRYIIAWRVGNDVYTRDSSFLVGATFTPATTTAMGIVKLHQASLTPATPVVLSDGDLNTANGVVSLNANKQASVTSTTGTVFTGISGGGNGSGFAGTGNGSGAGLEGTGGSTGPAEILHQVTNNSTPLLKTKDSSGNQREVIDHTGYMNMGRITTFEENWMGPAFSFGPTNVLHNILSNLSNVSPLFWNLSSTGNANAYYASANGIDTTVGSRFVEITLSDNAAGTSDTGNSAQFYTIVPILAPTNDMVISTEWESKTISSTLSGNPFQDAYAFFGLTDTPTNPSTGGAKSIGFVIRTDQANIRLLNNGIAEVDSGIARVNNTLYRFRMEYHGPNTPVGVSNGNTGTAVFYINDTLVGTLVNTVTGSLSFSNYILSAFGVNNGDGGIYTTPLMVKWNRYANTTL